MCNYSGSQFFTPVYSDIFDTVRMGNENDIIREANLFYYLLTQKKRIVLSFTQAMDSDYIMKRVSGLDTGGSFLNLCDCGLITIGNYGANTSESLKEHVCVKLKSEIENLSVDKESAVSFHFTSMPFLDELPWDARKAVFESMKIYLEGHGGNVSFTRDLGKLSEVQLYLETIKELSSHVAVRNEGIGIYQDITCYLAAVTSRLSKTQISIFGLNELVFSLSKCQSSGLWNRSKLYAFIEEDARRYGYNREQVRFAKILVDYAYNLQVGASLGVSSEVQFPSEYQNLFGIEKQNVISNEPRDAELFEGSGATWSYLSDFAGEVCTQSDRSTFLYLYKSRTKNEKFVRRTSTGIHLAIALISKAVTYATNTNEELGVPGSIVLSALIEVALKELSDYLDSTRMIYKAFHKTENYERLTEENIKIGRKLEEEFNRMDEM